MQEESSNRPEQSLLGKTASYEVDYNPDLLFPIPRAPKREEIGLSSHATLPFFGWDIWNAYELSWLNSRGKPQVALAVVRVDASTPHIIESKSFKLYLNSFNQTRLNDVDELQTRLQQDLSARVGGSVQVQIILPDQFNAIRCEELQGMSLDRLDVEINRYTPAPELLRADHSQAIVEEKFVSNLLKSNCLVTGQPDWASVQIHYVGAPIDQENLLKYLISFRSHNEFHEQCVERIFTDINKHCQPQKLSVYARYTRRGGLDINPWRSNFSTGLAPSNARNARQ